MFLVHFVPQKSKSKSKINDSNYSLKDNNLSRNFNSPKNQHNKKRSPSIIPLEMRLKEHDKIVKNSDYLHNNLSATKNSNKKTHHCTIV